MTVHLSPPSESDNPIKIYLKEIGEVSLLTPDEEIQLANLIRIGSKSEERLKKAQKQARKATDKTKTVTLSKKVIAKLKSDIETGNRARQKMIKANLRLVVKIAQDYANYGLPLLDLISEGNIGLMKAVERFEPSKGAKLSTYAAWWIKQAVKRALANQGKTIRLPVHLADKISRMRRISSQLTEEFGREPSDEELAEELDMTPSKVSQLRNVAIRPASLNATVGEEGEGSELGELVGDDFSRTPDHLIEAHDMTSEMFKMLDVLDERERLILTMRYGLDGRRAMTLEEVGAKFKVTRERIRQLQNLGLRKLRRAMDKKDQGVLSEGSLVS